MRLLIVLTFIILISIAEIAYADDASAHRALKKGGSSDSSDSSDSLELSESKSSSSSEEEEDCSTNTECQELYTNTICCGGNCQANCD